MAITGMTQLRFFGNNNALNTPYNIYTSYCEPSSFAKYAPIQQLGIQTLPGTKFFLNSNIDPIIIGASGIFEIDLRNTTGIISSLYFSLESMERINKIKNGYLIIDIVHSGGVG